MIIIKTPDQIEKMNDAGKILVETHLALREKIKPGVTTEELDKFVDDFIVKHGAYPEQKGYQGFPFAICASVNDEICHGFPRNEPLKEGDLLTVDMVVNYKGWLADSAWSYGVGQVSDEVQELMDVTRKCLYLGIEQAKPGNRLGDIGHAIESYATSKGYSVVRDFVGHGIGKDMHEDPKVLHYGKPGRGMRLEEGMVLTIEPMINQGSYRTTLDSNQWTARTIDGSLSAQYEHTIAITSDGARILTYQGEELPNLEV